MVEQKVALVTGASRGIGKAIATRLVEDGFLVLGTATTAEGAKSISGALGDNGVGYVLNLMDDDSIDQLFRTIKEAHDAPLVLVNNAGITKDNLALRMKEEEWNHVIGTNLSGLFKVTKRCLRGMTKARWGRVINLTSVVGAMGNPGQSNYAAAKAGVVGYSKSLAAELGSRGITVNCIAPGLIRTDMTNKLSDDQRNTMLERIPLGRLGAVTEVAALAGFLAAEAAGYITGETININGGMYMS
jgi:3-oxoacyl-[acyl-carrier protein] reductase|tara:strand:- start:7931 stop:8662 length:732 start_codon:yes stop_codon:yes gene_type:complete